MLGGFDDDILVALQGRPDVFDQQRLQSEGQIQADLGQLLAVLFGHFHALGCCGQALLTVKHLEKREPSRTLGELKDIPVTGTFSSSLTCLLKASANMVMADLDQTTKAE